MSQPSRMRPSVQRSSRGKSRASSRQGVRTAAPFIGDREMGTIVRIHRLLAVVAVAATSLFGWAGAASGQVATQVTVGTPHIIERGAEVSVPIAVTCDPSLNIAFGDATVQQVSGHKLAS